MKIYLFSLQGITQDIYTRRRNVYDYLRENIVIEAIQVKKPRNFSYFKILQAVHVQHHPTLSQKSYIKLIF